MLSKKQKTIMAILGSVGILFGLIVAIPFRSFPGLNKIENILTIELIIKLVLGVLSILLAVYPLIKKYKLIKWLSRKFKNNNYDDLFSDFYIHFRKYC